MMTWHERIARYKNDPKPSLIVPEAPERSGVHRVITYDELFHATSHTISRLDAHASLEARRLLVVADNSPECCVCILAGLAMGLTVVVLAPPVLGQTRQAWSRRVVQHADECAEALVVGARREIECLAELPAIEHACFEQLVSWTERPLGGLPPARKPQSAALWQYTSGTTGGAKIAQISHENLFHNLEAIGARVAVAPDDINTIWLPLFHDMGLIGSLLFAAHFGITGVLMTPRMFAARPESWLWAISRFGATLSAAPNVAYEICASKLDEERLRGLDLRSWRVAFNGAERVHLGTIQRFCQRFARYGFDRSAVYAVYGLAEHTLAAAMPSRVEGAKFDWVEGRALDTRGVAVPAPPGQAGAQAVASVGCALPRHEIRVVDEQGHVLADRRVGEVQLRGPSRMLGYRTGDSAQDHAEFLATGDLGYLADGELHVVGRKKHVIKRGGRGISAELVEASVRSLAGARGVVAAFGAADAEHGTERLVVLVECSEPDLAKRAVLVADVLRAVKDAAECTPDVVELVKPGAIPRTTSGKIRHAAARSLYLEGGLHG